MKKRTSAKKRTKSQAVHHAVRMAVVPHKKNSYRPHIVRWHGLALLAVLVVGVQLSYNFIQTGSVLGQATTINAQELLAATNNQREARSETPLKLNAALSQAAALKAKDMFKENYWAHTSPSGTEPWQWFKVAGYQYSSAGENLAKGFHTSSGTVTAWMNSKDHRENILNDSFSDVGFAVVSGKLNGEKTTLVVALYGAPLLARQAVVGQPAVLAAADQPVSVVTRLGVGLQSMTPALLGSIMLLTLGAAAALAAHYYRKKLPKPLRASWYRHHGLYKAVGMTSLVVMLIALYGGGQI